MNGICDFDSGQEPQYNSILPANLSALNKKRCLQVVCYCGSWQSQNREADSIHTIETTFFLLKFFLKFFFQIFLKNFF